MANVWFGSDFHFGHKNIQRFRIGPWSTEEEHREWIIQECNKVISKRDDVYLLGDIAFSLDALRDVSCIKGARKFLVRGNHDKLPAGSFLTYFKDIYGLWKYKGFWLSHAPIHPDELRGRVNLHGHVHYEDIRKPFNPVYDVVAEKDPRYFNCCVENLLRQVGRPIISLDEIRKLLSETTENS